MEKTLLQRSLDTFLEDLGPEKLIAGFAMALVGFTVSILIEGATRKPDKEGTPVEWSWHVFLCDKLPRFLKACLLNTLVIFLSLRFMDRLIGDFSMLYCALVGFCLDDVKEKWKALRENFKLLKGKGAGN